MKNTNKKLVIAVIALAVALACTFGVVVAWMTASTATVTNTFTVGDIEITLVEYDDTDAPLPAGRVYEDFKPGDVFDKDARVTVKAGSEKCWLYVKVVPVENTSNASNTIIEYAVDTTKWTAVPGEANLYYMTVDETDADAEYHVLTDDKITINDELTSDECANISANLSLEITAYAIQFEAAATAEAAWAAVTW